MQRALLVIDIQNDYFAGGELELFAADETAERIKAAILDARQAGDRVVLVQHVSTAPKGMFASGSAGVAIRPDILEAADGVPVVVKHVADAFQDTDLATHLDGIDSLLVCGMMTQNCVVFTAMSAHAQGYNVSVVEDLCTAPTEVVHTIALSALKSKLNVQTSRALWT